MATGERSGGRDDRSRERMQRKGGYRRGTQSGLRVSLRGRDQVAGLCEMENRGDHRRESHNVDSWERGGGREDMRISSTREGNRFSNETLFHCKKNKFLFSNDSDFSFPNQMLVSKMKSRICCCFIRSQSFQQQKFSLVAEPDASFGNEDNFVAMPAMPTYDW